MFLREDVVYLGYVVSAKGVAMDKDRVCAIVEPPAPRTLRALRGFLGLAGYYRKLMKDYGTMAVPLTRLLK